MSQLLPSLLGAGLGSHFFELLIAFLHGQNNLSQPGKSIVRGLDHSRVTPLAVLNGPQDFFLEL